MKYLALYRKYRPDRFEKVIGQDHIVKILSAQVRTGKIGHAYLFCGARGTGKTSVAKIFAKALNCASPEDGSPCGKCPDCLKQGYSNIDIIEIDAASNNKVEDIREIIDNAQYPPTNGKYKVYIIDEVHMLSGAAFNALLKTLEEPPSHAVFILATTEVYKLPATILSRCMRFDFRLIPTAKIAQLLKDVLNDTGKPFEETAVVEIARAAEGSVRDALSIADTCLSYSEGKLKHSDVLDMLAASDRGKIAALCDCILKRDSGGLLKGIEELCSAGKAVTVLNKDLLMYLRDLSILKTCPDQKDMLFFPPDTIDKYREAIADYDINKILRCIEVLSAAEADIKYSLHPRIIFEAAALKCAVSRYDRDEDSFEARLSEIENQLKEMLDNKIKVKENPLSARENSNQEESKSSGACDNNTRYPEYGIPAAPPEEYDYNAINFALENKQDNTNSQELNKENQTANDKSERVARSGKTESAQVIWGNVIRTLRQTGAGLLYTLCGNLSAEISGNDFIVLADNDISADILNKPKNLEKLKNIINNGKEYNVIIKKKSVLKNAAEDDIEKLKELSGGKLIIKE
jgi:DNA polymerase-3 subunit gamma/tau